MARQVSHYQERLIRMRKRQKIALIIIGIFIVFAVVVKLTEWFN